jgi:thiamine-monophosphate kinase
MLTEFELIRRYFSFAAPGVALGVGDDAALLELSAGAQLVAATDMLVCDRHFSRGADPFKLGHKALAVNLSDMAAMGATPRWALIALALPQVEEAWLEAFSAGFIALARAHEVALVGGDTTRGPLNICVQILGEVPINMALRRDGAKTGDEIWVSGTLGEAALALAHTQSLLALDPGEAERCISALDMPTPRIALGKALRGIAHSAIDISDGLVADLGHILESSRLAAVIEFARLPTSPAMRRLLPNEAAIKALLAGGDDYELCFTAARSDHTRIAALGCELELVLTCIGWIEKGAGLTLLDTTGKPMPVEVTGFDHFR